MIVEATARPVARTGATFDPWKRAELAVGAFVAGYSNERTRDAYLQDLKAWLAFLEGLGITDPIEGAVRQHFEVFMRNMERHGKAVATIARRVGTAQLWYEWLVDEEYLLRSPGRKVKRPSVPNISTTPWLPTRQFQLFLDTAAKRGGYDAAACLVMGLLGLRVSELVSANVEDVIEVDYHHVLRFVGKGGKHAEMPIPPRAMKAVTTALAGRDTGPLILNQWNRRLTRECMQRTIDRVCKQANIDVPLTPHGLRHSAITAGLNGGVPIRDMQLFARHSNPSTTSRYDRGALSFDKNAAYTLSQILA